MLAAIAHRRSPKESAMVALKTLLFTILVPGTVIVLIPGMLLTWTNPPAAIYIGVILCVSGEAIIFVSARLLIYAVFLFLCFHGFVIAYEEPTLRRIFGSSYVQYCAAVPRWVPHIWRKLSP